MKRISLTVFIVLVVIFSLITLGLNIYKGISILNLNNTISFSNEYYPVVSDNYIDYFQPEVNPVSILLQTNQIRVRTLSIQNEIINKYNILTDNISSLTEEISEISNQAETLAVNISNKIEASPYIFIKSSNYEESLFKGAKDRYAYLVDYKGYLKQVFQNFKTDKTKLAEFSNPLWGYSDVDLLNLINSMSDEDKAGQLLFFSFEGLTLNDTQISRYRALNPGGMIIMGNNASYPKQLQALTAQIQKINPDIPMFIPTDEEGGVVKRIGWDTTAGERDWAGMTDNAICDLGTQRSELLLKLGINMNFSPVVDLTHQGNAFINNRTISSDPHVVTEKSNSYITCGQNHGIIDTLKHFPGHGPTTLDSHYQLPYVTKSKTDWLSSDAMPFLDNLGVKQIMIGQLVYTNIDKDNPATLSRIFLTDILRNEWGYKGLIITDDMNMLHTSTHISVYDALLRTFNAGTDIAVYVGAPTSFEDVKAQLVNLIETDAISRPRIDDALMRILKAKRDMNY